MEKRKFKTEEKLAILKEASEKGIEGRIIVSFVVETDGSITNVEVIRGNLGYGCEEYSTPH